MSARERKLALAVVACLAVGLVVGGYLFVLQPLDEANAQTAQLLADIDGQQKQLEAIARDKPRLDDAIRRSLPANPDTAGREYEALISKLLNDAEVPAAGRSVKLKAVETKAPPLNPGEQDAKKQIPAYTAIGLEVSLKRVRYATLLDVLYRYYQLNVLHQITKFKVERRDDTGARRSNQVNADLPDLNVDFTSTAIILNEAENRRSLLPVPKHAAAVAGGLGFAGIQQSPETARGLTPWQYVPVLATVGRDYRKLLTADMFHGPPPPPPKPTVFTEPPKEDTSDFIRLTSLGRNSDGTGSATIEDIASHDHKQYVIEVTRVDGKLKPSVSKFYHNSKGVKKLLDDPSDTLDISDDSSSTARMFRLVGLDSGGLVLASRESGKPDTGRKGAKGSTSSKLAPPPSPAGAAAAGAGAVAPAEHVFLWKIGEPLSKVKELSAAEAKQAVLQATGGAAETVRTATVAEDAGR